MFQTFKVSHVNKDQTFKHQTSQNKQNEDQKSQNKHKKNIKRVEINNEKGRPMPYKIMNMQI